MSPLDAEGSYATVTCDGALAPGWSGAGVFVDGKLSGTVSYGNGQTAFGPGMFGEDEVSVSEVYWSRSLGSEINNKYFTTGAEVFAALKDRYASAIDLARQWQEKTISMIQEKFPYLELEFTRWPVPTEAFSPLSGFRSKCVHGEALPPNGTKVLGAVSAIMSSFLPKYVLFNDDSSVRGVTEANDSSPFGGPGPFNIGLNFTWANVSRVPGGAAFSPIEEQNSLLLTRFVPYCAL